MAKFAVEYKYKNKSRIVVDIVEICNSKEEAELKAEEYNTTVVTEEDKFNGFIYSVKKYKNKALEGKNLKYV